MSKIVFFDTETTGMAERGQPVFVGHKMVEIAFLTMEGLDTYIPFQQYLNPLQPISPGAFDVHGLSSEFLKDYPAFPLCAEKIIEQIRGAVLIAHNAPFDIAFLDNELKNAGFGPASQYCEEVIDTLVIARKKFPGQKNSLDALCQRFGISISHRTFHGGLKDCYLLSQVYRALRKSQGLFDFSESEPLLSISGQVSNNENLISCCVSPQEMKEHEQFLQNKLS